MITNLVKVPTESGNSFITVSEVVALLPALGTKGHTVIKLSTGGSVVANISTDDVYKLLSKMEGGA